MLGGRYMAIKNKDNSIYSANGFVYVYTRISKGGYRYYSSSLKSKEDKDGNCTRLFYNVVFLDKKDKETMDAMSSVKTATKINVTDGFWGTNYNEYRETNELTLFIREFE